MGYVLGDVFGVLSSADPFEGLLLLALPDGLRARPHYGQLLQVM